MMRGRMAYVVRHAPLAREMPAALVVCCADIRREDSSSDYSSIGVPLSQGPDRVASVQNPGGGSPWL